MASLRELSEVAVEHTTLSLTLRYCSRRHKLIKDCVSYCKCAFIEYNLARPGARAAMALGAAGASWSVRAVLVGAVQCAVEALDVAQLAQHEPHVRVPQRAHSAQPLVCLMSLFT